MGTKDASDNAERAILQLRLISNAAISRREIGPAIAILQNDVKVIASNGTVIDGADAMERAFKESFADPDFVNYHRELLSVDVGDATAVESGRWEGRWRSKLIRGNYMARWQYSSSSWHIAAELYVPLACATM